MRQTEAARAAARAEAGRDTDGTANASRRRLLLGAGALGLAGLAGCAARPARRPPGPGAGPAMPPSGAGQGAVAAAPVPALRAGAQIAIVAPASAAPGAADRAAIWLASRGFAPVVMPAARTRMPAPFDYLAGPDAARLQDLHAAFSDPAIGAVWCLQGGFGSWRLLDQVDYGLLRANPKPFIGYSDITALHLAIQRHAGFVTFHGPMPAQDGLGDAPDAGSEPELWAMLGGQMGQGSWIEPPADSPPVALAPGVATGRLVGGNLALIGALTGSRHAIDTRDAILFIEDVNEAIPRIDRLLSQLRAAGKFAGLKGVLAGRFSRLLGQGSDDESAQAALYPLLQAHFQPLGIPVLANWPSGHIEPNLTLPLGATVTLDTARAALRLEQAVTLAGAPAGEGGGA